MLRHRWFRAPRPHSAKHVALIPPLSFFRMRTRPHLFPIPSPTAAYLYAPQERGAPSRTVPQNITIVGLFATAEIWTLQGVGDWGRRLCAPKEKHQNPSIAGRTRRYVANCPRMDFSRRLNLGKTQKGRGGHEMLCGGVRPNAPWRRRQFLVWSLEFGVWNEF